MGEGSYKATKGLIRVRADTSESKIREIMITGDFFMYPEDSLWILEKILQGTAISRETILAKIENFYSSIGVLTPGVTPDDFTEAIMRAISST